MLAWSPRWQIVPYRAAYHLQYDWAMRLASCLAVVLTACAFDPPNASVGNDGGQAGGQWAGCHR